MQFSHLTPLFALLAGLTAAAPSMPGSGSDVEPRADITVNEAERRRSLPNGRAPVICWQDADGCKCLLSPLRHPAAFLVAPRSSVRLSALPRPSRARGSTIWICVGIGRR